jgi:hypothetical protein
MRDDAESIEVRTYAARVAVAPLHAHLAAMTAAGDIARARTAGGVLAKVADGVYTDTFEAHDGGRLLVRRTSRGTGASLQTLPRAVRAEMLAAYRAVDVANCWPTLLDGLTGHHFPLLGDYVAHRDERLAALAAACGVSAGAAKEAILEVCGGAEPDGPRVSGLLGGAGPSTWLRALAAEAEAARVVLVAAHPECADVVVRGLRRARKHEPADPAARAARLARRHAIHVVELYERRVFDAAEAFHAARGERVVLPLSDGYYVDAPGVDARALAAEVERVVGVALVFTVG